MPPLTQRQTADVHIVLLEQIVCEKPDRHAAENRRCQLLAPDALLQVGEWTDRAVLPCHQFSIEHHAIGQGCGGSDDFRKSRGDQVLAARPDKTFALAPDELAAYAVPLPFGEPRGALAESGRAVIERRGEVERVGRRGIRVGRLCGSQRFPELRAGTPLAHHPSRNIRPRDIQHFGERTHDEQLRYTDTQLTGQKLVEQEAFAVRQRAPPVEDGCLLLLLACGTQR